MLSPSLGPTCTDRLSGAHTHDSARTRAGNRKITLPSNAQYAPAAATSKFCRPRRRDRARGGAYPNLPYD
jgi:hypothetical protein